MGQPIIDAHVDLLTARYERQQFEPGHPGRPGSQAEQDHSRRNPGQWPAASTMAFVLKVSELTVASARRIALPAGACRLSISGSGNPEHVIG